MMEALLRATMAETTCASAGKPLVQMCCQKVYVSDHKRDITQPRLLLLVVAGMMGTWPCT